MTSLDFLDDFIENLCHKCPMVKQCPMYAKAAAFWRTALAILNGLSPYPLSYVEAIARLYYRIGKRVILEECPRLKGFA